MPSPKKISKTTDAKTPDSLSLKKSVSKKSASRADDESTGAWVVLKENEMTTCKSESKSYRNAESNS